MLHWTLALAACIAAQAPPAKDFLIGYWWGPSEPRQQDFALVAQANFTVAMVGGETVADARKLLDLCQANGLKALLLVDGDRLMAKSATDPEFHSTIDGVIRDYAGHPALWGYYVFDEPRHPEQIMQIAAVNQYLLLKDPNHVPFINILPIHSWQPYEQNVHNYLATVQPRLLSYDKYSLFPNAEAPDHFENLGIIRREALEYNISFNLIRLATGVPACRDPSEADLRWQAYGAIGYGARGIMYYTYVTPPPDMPAYIGWGEGIVKADGTPGKKYAWVQRINATVLHWAPTLLRLVSTGVCHTEPVPQGCVPLTGNEGITRIEGGQFVVGFFTSDQGETYAMLVHRAPRAPAYDARVVFSRPVRLALVDPVDGQERPAELLNENGLTVWQSRFEPGEGKLVHIQ